MHVIDFGMMPVYMGCVSGDPEEDKFHQMKWGIDSNGLLAVLDPPTLDLVYLNQHSEPTASQLWIDHHTAFADFMLEDLATTQVLEIGGGSGLLAKIVREKSEEALLWTILEPCAPEQKPDGIEWIEGWFPSDAPAKIGSALVATHVLEHATNPQDFIRSCASYLDLGEDLIISWPNMLKMAERRDLNMLNFEHLHFLPHETVESMFIEEGFDIIATYDFRGHSIFLKARKSSLTRSPSATKKNTEGLLTLAQSYRDSLDQLVAALNGSIEEWDGEVNLFGAHIFSQYLIARGLNLARVTRILDNSTHKQGQRLYGTNLSVAAPEAVRGKSGQLILVAAALYEAEILEQLLTLELLDSKVHASRLGLRTLF
jgi:hypothetical protein